MNDVLLLTNFVAQVQIPVAGHFYPFVGKKPVVRIATYDEYKDYLPQTKETAPAVDLGLIFRPPPPGFPYRTTQAVIHVRRQSYYIIGYHRDPLDRPDEINQTLRKVLPNLTWRGELIVFHIGSRVPLLSREPSNSADLRCAITTYVLESN